MNRPEARAAAMKLLYEMEMGGDGGEDTKLNLLEVSPGEDESDYMNQTFEGAKGMLGELDERIQRYCVGWKLERVTRVDLSILRLAVYELLRGMCTSLIKVISILTVMESSWLTMLVWISATPSWCPIACLTSVSMACTETRTEPFSVFCTETEDLSTLGSRRKASIMTLTDQASKIAASA